MDTGRLHHYLQWIMGWQDTHAHELQHEDVIRWVGGVFDPKGFDLNRLNREWRVQGAAGTDAPGVLTDRLHVGY
jgi:hypothetical protein